MKSHLNEIYDARISRFATRLVARLELILSYILIPVIIPIVIILKLISLIKPVRIQRIDIGRIGHVYPAFSYLARKKMKRDPSKGFDLFYFVTSSGIVSNHQLKKMLEKELTILPAALILSTIQKWGIKLFGPETFSMELPTYTVGKSIWLKYQYHNNFPILNFTPAEIAAADKELVAMGIPQNAKVICFHMRDSTYLDKIASTTNWKYHDYRDSSIENYLVAMNRYAAETGYYFVRMGAITKDKITENNPKIIDYANSSFRSELMDMYLSFRCEFFITTDSGMSIFPEMMGKPIVFLNMVCIARFDPWGHHVIYLPKKLYLTAEKRFLKFAEIMHQYVGIDPSTEKLNKLGIEMVENSSEEIFQAIKEMDQTLNYQWKPSEEDDSRQNKYWQIYGQKPNGPNLRVGADFLRQYQAFLE